MNTIVVGITGSIGTGKSTLAEFLTEENGEHLDADKIAKDLMQPGREAHEAVVNEFGETVLDEEGNLRPDRLAEVVFSDQDKLSKLEGILHPLVLDKISQYLDKNDSLFYVIEAPLLFESGGDELCDWVVVVTAPEDEVIDRLQDRSLGPEEIEQRRSRQLPQSEKVKRADEVVENDGSLEELREKANKLLDKIRSQTVQDRD